MKEFINSCRVRLILMLAGVILFVIYRVLLIIPGAADRTYVKVIHPLHELMASACDHVKCSVAEILIGCVCIALIVYLVLTVIRCFRERRILKQLGELIVTLCMCFCLIYGGFCILWGVYYSAEDMGVAALCGISSEGNTHEELIKVDRYFVNLANEYSRLVNRDDNGCYVMNEDQIFDYSTELYDSVASEYPLLEANPHRAKPVFFSRLVSYLDFTGFFFPFTAEANINTDSPDCYIPSTIAHELAHQRGIAEEDEANFMAVLACLEDGNTDYVYSASLLALVHLQNALYKSGDTDAWQEIHDSYSEGVKADLAQNSAYWAPFHKNVVTKATTATYDAFLKSYDQELGVETYGKCVDLLVDYYGKETE